MNDPTTAALQQSVKSTIAVWVRSLLDGSNPYGQVDGQSVHLIPAKACAGRAGV